MKIYYNDFEPSAVAWLRELIQFGLLPEGDVDSRSIKDVKTDELRGYDQCHFFAGIGGWPLAMQLASVASAKSVWTGSCPCQPFSQAGKRKGTDDERHLWPDFARLIDECRPSTVFGEQVQEAVKLGWLDDVSSDLEKSDYAFGSVVLGAHSVGAPHIRQRLFWVAHAAGGSRWKRGQPKNLEDQVRIFALNLTGNIEETARLSLSPTFVRRLMGYPVEWGCCGALAMRSSRKSRRSLSEPRGIQSVEKIRN